MLEGIKGFKTATISVLQKNHLLKSEIDFNNAFWLLKVDFKS